MKESSEPDDPFAMLAGTLCLMSCPRSGEAPLFVRRIIANLERLAAHPAVNAELRTVCRRLAVQWEERLAAPAITHGPTPLH
jgi:hypothetical protein